MNSTAFLSLALGSLLGGFARFGVASAMARGAGPAFPYGIFVVNMLGCFLIGAFDALSAGRLNAQARLFLITGFCGAFTTFSTLVLDTAHLLSAQQYARAAFNSLGSLAAGLVLFWAGSFAAGRVP